MQIKTNYRYLKTSLVFFLILFCSGTALANHVLKSPDGKVVIEFDLKDTSNQQGYPTYNVKYNGRPVIADSHLGFAIKESAPLESGFEVIAVSRTSRDSTYSPVYGERKTIRDNYNQLIVELKETKPPHRKLLLKFRAYNEGAAFCYSLPQQNGLKNFVISAEKTQFRFMSDHTAYAVYSAQGQYSKVPLSQIKNNCERPLTIRIDEGLYAAVAEAKLVDYARMKLSPDKNQPLTLVSSLHGEVNISTPIKTPWRIIMLGKSSGELLERNYLLLNLNEPCAIDDPSWIKPGMNWLR